MDTDLYNQYMTFSKAAGDDFDGVFRQHEDKDVRNILLFSRMAKDYIHMERFNDLGQLDASIAEMLEWSRSQRTLQISILVFF
jgi:hypothetical protein